MNGRIRGPAVRAVVIGYGNPMRGDDALGWHVADALAAIPEIAADLSIRIETAHQLTPEIAEAIADARTVVFIDATAPSPNQVSGILRCEEISPLSPSPGALGHHLAPSQALDYARLLFGANPKAYVASVTTESFDYGAALSPAVDAALPLLVEWTRARIMPGCMAT